MNRDKEIRSSREIRENRGYQFSRINVRKFNGRPKTNIQLLRLH